MRIRNSNVNVAPFLVTRLARDRLGRHFGEVMPRESIGHPFTFSESETEATVYLVPTGPQLQSLITMLDQGDLSLDELVDLGGEHGGTTTL